MTDEEIRLQLEQQDRELRSIAYHEAGHAVVAFLLGRWILSITIVPGYDECPENDKWPEEYLGRAESTGGHSYEDGG
ncbi:MAG TPA: hypothetical protein VIX91_22440 [Candidatus Acidoferrum sp.]